MTTERFARTVFAPKPVLCLLALVGMVGCIGHGSHRRGGLPGSVVAGYPKEVAQSYALFARKCSRCHTLARPLAASIQDPEHWEIYVARMRRHPGSGISVADAEEIMVFLRHYTREKNKEHGALPPTESDSHLSTFAWQPPRHPPSEVRAP